MKVACLTKYNATQYDIHIPGPYGTVVVKYV